MSIGWVMWRLKFNGKELTMETRKSSYRRAILEIDGKGIVFPVMVILQPDIGGRMHEIGGIISVVIIHRLFYAALQPKFVPMFGIGFNMHGNLVVCIYVEFIIVKLLGQDVDEIPTVFVEIDVLDGLRIIIGENKAKL